MQPLRQRRFARGAHLRPKPAWQPFGVAVRADAWTWDGPWDNVYRPPYELLRRHCEEIGRPFEEITLSCQLAVSFPEDASTFEHIEPGQVLVMDCRGDASVASAGSILVTRMMVRGAAGVVSDGGLRDSPEIAKLLFPAYCQGGSAPTNLIKHHAVDLNVPIGCGGVPVFPGDICVGDGEGVVIIPAGIAEEIADLAAEQDLFETFVIERVREGASTFGLYPPNEESKQAYASWKAKRG